MKRKIANIALISALILLTTGCSQGETSKINSETSKESQSSQSSVISDTTTTTSESEPVSETSATTAEESSKDESKQDVDTPFPVDYLTMPDGREASLAEASMANETNCTFDFAYIRYPKMQVVTNADKADAFDFGNYEYNGEEVSVDKADWTMIKKGDKIGDLTVEEAQMLYSYYSEDEQSQSSSIVFSGSTTVDAYLYYYVEDDMYFAAGDVIVIPVSEGNTDFPLRTSKGTIFFNEKTNTAFYGDCDLVAVGNISALANGDVVNANKPFAKAKVTLTDISYGGMGTCYATVTAITL